MVRARGSYPHPVVDHSDDVDSIFTISQPTGTSGPSKFELNFNLTLTDPDLQRMLDENSAQLAVRWRCAQTFKLGTLHPTLVLDQGTTRSFRVVLNQDDLAGRFRVEPEITAVVANDSYSLVKQNPDYGDTTFAIMPGDLLAHAGTLEIDAEKSYDPLNPPIDACFRFELDPTVPRGIDVDFSEQDYVVVRIASETYIPFTALAGQPQIQISMIMMPALMAALSFIQGGDAEGDLLDDFGWARALKTLIDRLKVAEASPLVQAQAILDDPIGQAARTLFEVEKGDEA